MEELESEDKRVLTLEQTKRKQRRKQYHLCHLEQIHAQKREYYQKNKELIKAKVHHYGELHKEKIKEYNKLYNIKNRIATSERNKIYAKTHVEQIRIMKRIYAKNNRSKINEYCRRNYYRIRSSAISHYSNGLNRCACCGETDIRFLTFDHIDGGGHKHRQSTNLNLVAWLYKHKFPHGFQVLCFNCNCGRAFNAGICPHKSSLLLSEMKIGTKHKETI